MTITIAYHNKRWMNNEKSLNQMLADRHKNIYHNKTELVG